MQEEQGPCLREPRIRASAIRAAQLERQPHELLAARNALHRKALATYGALHTHARGSAQLRVSDILKIRDYGLGSIAQNHILAFMSLLLVTLHSWDPTLLTQAGWQTARTADEGFEWCRTARRR